MSTKSGNNYQHFQEPGAEGEGNGEAPPPAFNPDAVSPADYTSYGAIPSQQQQQHSPISQPQYVQQGISQPPIQQQIIQQPQYQPIPQQQVQYINPYNQQQQQPVIVVPPQNIPQQTIIYAQPQQNSALIPPVAYKPLYDYRNPTNKDKQKRFVAVMGGIISCVLLLSAMGSHTLASGTTDGFDIECSILYLHSNDYLLENRYAYYSDFCWNFDSDVHWDNWEDTDSSNWCETWRGASIWISCVVFGCLMTCLATLWVQPMCICQRCCCPITCPRIFYIFGLILCILGNVLWVTNDQVCLPKDNGFGLNIGVSIDLVSGACVLIFITLFCAK